MIATFPFLSHQGFMGAAGRTEPCAYGVAGICWDGSVTNRPGARMGPQAIRRASQMLCDGTHPQFGVSPLGHVQDHGDLALPGTSLQAMRQALMPQAHALLEHQHMVWLGGDHSITLPLLRALREKLRQPLAVVHLDAHCDTWPNHFGEPSGHGTWVHEALQEGLVVPEAFVQIGLRSAAEKPWRDRVKDAGGLILPARELRGLDGPAQLAPVLAQIRQRMGAANSPPVYLTVDIDCLDPAFAPGTGTPEPAGLSSSQVMTIIEELADLNFVGMDCVEVSPPYDHAEITALAAAHIVWTYLCGRLALGRSAVQP